MGRGTFKHWDAHWQRPPGESALEDLPSGQIKNQKIKIFTVEGNKVPVVHMKNVLQKTFWIISALGKGKLICSIVFAQGPGHT